MAGGRSVDESDRIDSCWARTGGDEAERGRGEEDSLRGKVADVETSSGSYFSSS
jgi:hypothetical protein